MASNICLFLSIGVCCAAPATAASRFLAAPFSDPNIVLTQGWVYNNASHHHGIDYALPPAAPFTVVAAAAGRAVVVLKDITNQSGYGNFVYIVHDPVDPAGLRYFTIYAHLRSGSWLSSLKVKSLSEIRSDTENNTFTDWVPVEFGKKIGDSGDTGNADGIHLHFEVQRGGYALNKTDPYNISTGESFLRNLFPASYYPPSGLNFTTCGLNFLWITCPILAQPPLPTAGFVMTSSGQSKTEGQTLNLSVPLGGNASVGFDSSRSTDAGGQVVGWNWKIDGVTASTAKTFVSSLGIGTHNISLIVTDNLGAQSAVATATIIVAQAVPTVGTVFIQATLDGAPISVSVSYNLVGPQGTFSELSAPVTVPNVTVGQYTLNYLSGGPQGSSLIGIAPCQTNGLCTQALTNGQTITFTLQFASTISTSWAQKFPSTVPPSRSEHVMVFDGSSGKTVLFGGVSFANGVFTVLGDTWTWDGSNWTQRFPSSSPSPREFAAAAFDALHQQIVLFGGNDSATKTLYSDTWTWDGTTWTQKFPTVNPGALGDGQQMVYDAQRAQVVLFDGRNRKTWIWDGSNWTQKVLAISPPARVAFAMSYDPARGEAVLFGGIDNLVGLRLGDTWTWDGTTWTQKFPATSPPATSYPSMAYDGSDKTVLLFGGGDFNTVFRNLTWAWDGTNWTQKVSATSPSPRSATGMAYDSNRGQIVLFGGWTGPATVFVNDTWVWGSPNGGTTYFDTTSYIPLGAISSALGVSPAAPVIYYAGASIVPSATWSVNQIRVGLKSSNQTGSDVRLYIFTGSLGSAPIAVSSNVYTPTDFDASNNYQIKSFSFPLFTMNSGTEYKILLGPADPLSALVGGIYMSVPNTGFGARTYPVYEFASDYMCSIYKGITQCGIGPISVDINRPELQGIYVAIRKE